MGRPLEVYLDIETDGGDVVTVIGFDSSETGRVQLADGEVTRGRLLATLPRSGRLFTFNGERFDMPKIRQFVGVDLFERFESCDLMRVGWAHGYQGGQKSIEDQLGFERSLPGLDGLAAIGLWADYGHGNDTAMGTLLAYNGEDLEGMRFIKRHLEATCCITTHGEAVVTPPSWREKRAAPARSAI